MSDRWKWKYKPAHFVDIFFLACPFFVFYFFLKYPFLWPFFFLRTAIFWFLKKWAFFWVAHFLPNCSYSRPFSILAYQPASLSYAGGPSSATHSDESLPQAYEFNLRYSFWVSYTVFRVGWITFFLVNRVENQNEPKRPQSGGRLGSFWFSTRPSADTSTDYNLHHALN